MSQERIEIEIPLDVQQRMLQFFFDRNLKKYLEEEEKKKNAPTNHD